MRRRERRATSAVAIGSVIAGRYRIEDKLGEGGMAEVFRALDEATSRHVALKLLHPEVATNPEAVERTKREGQVLSALHNPAIVNVETYGELEDGTVFLVMELLGGETLGQRMKRGPLDPAELAPIVAGTCAGLHAAHSRGIVHRDLKPDNIFLCPTEHGLQVKLLDFGISKVYGEQKLTQTGEVLGTPRYMSPEQLGAEPDIDVRVDVYALGVILYEALAGKPPFLATTPTDLIIAILNGKIVPLRSVRADVPPNVEAVVLRAMNKVRDARYDTAMALAESYIDAIGGPSAVRSLQRRGMATQAMGGMKTAPVAPPGELPPAGAPAAEPGKLPIGTFSGLGDPGGPAAGAAPPPKGTMQMGASPGAPVPEAPPQRIIPATSSPEDPDGGAMPRTRHSPLEEAPLGLADTPSSASRRSVPATAMMDASQSMSALQPVAPSPPAPAPRSKPSGAGRVLLVLGALLAGAASAAAVIFGLRALEPSDAGPATAGGGPEEGVVPEEVADAGAGDAAVADAAVDAAGVPSGEDAPPAVDPTEVTPEPASGRRRRRRRGRTTRRDAGAPDAGRTVLPGFGGGGGGGGGGQDRPLTPIQQARRALRAGDPDRCVEILDEAIRSGASAIALRRRADCHEAAGRRSEAIRDYRRFCRLVPDHPSISEVRPLLESWGQSCP